jgi:RNA 3'-terminal phosphate cyclase
MGVHLEILDVKAGYYPVGRGHIIIRVQKKAVLHAINIVELGKPQRVVITYYVKDNKLPGSSKELRKDIKKILANTFGEDIKV